MLLLLYSLYRRSDLSVVFVFNALVNDAVPVSPILFPVDSMKKMEKKMNC